MDYDTLNSASKNLLILLYEKEGRILVCFYFSGFFALLSCFLTSDGLFVFSLKARPCCVVCGSNLATWHIFGNETVGKWHFQHT